MVLGVRGSVWSSPYFYKMASCLLLMGTQLPARERMQPQTSAAVSSAVSYSTESMGETLVLAGVFLGESTAIDLFLLSNNFI